MSTEEQFPTEAAPAGGAPRSLAEALRGRDDRSLAVLLRARPDLITPVPTDLTQLATRAGTRASVVRALERLDRFALQTAQALAVAGDPASYDELAFLLAGDDADPAVTAALPHALGTLRDQALVWGPEHRLRLVRTARELLAPSPQHPSPTGLGPTVAEATAGMSPGRVQEIVAAAGLASTHDSVSAVTSLAALFTDRRRMAALLATAPAESLDVLTRLVWGPPYGQVTASPAPHLRWLLDRGLLLPTAPGTVVIPREVALHLRSGRAHRDVQPVPPPVEASGTHRPQVVDATAAGQAYTALATVEELLKDWDEGGPGVLRAGGLSVRDLKRTAVALDLPEPVAAFWVELAYAAGLLASDGEADERYAATPAYDEWLELPAAERWTRLATAWLTATRTPGVIGERDAKDRTLSALGPGLDRSAAPEVRHRVLALLAGLPEGTSATPDSVLARLHWERPTRGGQHPHQAPAQSSPAHQPPQSQASHAAPASPASQQPAARSRQGEDLRARIARWTLSEAESLGITGRGALSSHGRALLGLPDGAHAPAELPETPGDKLPAHHVPLPHPPASAPAPDAVAERAAAAARAARLLAPLLPEPLDHVLLQADLTAVAPGPLKRPLADMLGVLADVESKGGATVYRFTPGSVRRALDAGRSASDLHDFLTAHSRTPVPQPLAYLIDDVARRHGHLRIGAASAYVRCDDDAMLSEILADKRSQGLGLRRLAPTVLAAQTDPATLLDGLRAMGYAPAAESAEGDVLITRAHARRTPPRTAPEPVPDGPPAPDDTLLGAAIRAIRAGDLASTTPRRPSGGPPTAPGALPRTGAAETLATMQAAVLTGEALWIGYVNAEGSASQRVIAPVRVEGGFVTAYDHTADEVRTFPLHRITGVAELADDSI
ncbi:helicase C-terminal domain-containing protein [Streptomyces caniscabiei]|uniref:helicase C-terminal domain-containing protein n=1 Tax=Streptomyces caniscabiei TaxID=2746961 RepID=UPI0029B08A2A|nr:helicase C-terminal domain-containing protein [Streptomyces caniscabiei]MDX2602982.1 helicase C-terminal domain-containing protein [Streptomyces caniscabiei]MDX2737731.1 helicase C-terminal domain-containing protein [Streptomyces caniscabiei]MDX2782604.1 helicase C-terminal domain-containing protein [Streptomyces caniscabiei]